MARQPGPELEDFLPYKILDTIRQKSLSKSPEGRNQIACLNREPGESELKVYRSTYFVSAALAVTLTFAASAFAQHADAMYSATATTPTTDSDPWWKHAVIYEVYPRSFADSNGDGVGDLNGITQHLDYLQQLGVDTIWLAPIYPSPQVDFGYDISDYEAVDPQYGTLKDFDRLLAEAKKCNLRIVLDMVLNHTSDKDPWFIESASSRANPKADWYVWNDGIPASTPNLPDAQKQNVHKGPKGDVAPPNNWQSAFGGSAWEWVPARQQFYYHMFYPQQPDLNWRNPEVEQAMFNVMRFWLDRGVSGFRLDAIQTLYEDPQLRSAPQGNAVFSLGYTYDLPEIHDVLRRLHAMVASYPGQRVLIGELFEPSMAGLDKFYGGEAKNELQLPMDYFFGFPHLLTGNSTAPRTGSTSTSTVSTSSTYPRSCMVRVRSSSSTITTTCAPSIASATERTT